MPLIDYSKPMDFCDAVDAAAIILQICLTKLRDEAAFRDDDDHAPLYAAQLLVNMLESARRETDALSDQLEKRLMGNTRSVM